MLQKYIFQPKLHLLDNILLITILLETPFQKQNSNKCGTAIKYKITKTLVWLHSLSLASKIDFY